MDKLLTDTLIDGKNKLRCLDISYNYLFPSHFISQYRGVLTTLQLNYSRFMHLEYLEGGWAEGIERCVLDRQIDTVSFVRGCTGSGGTSLGRHAS